MYGVWTYCPTCHIEIAALCPGDLDMAWRTHQASHTPAEPVSTK